MSWSPTDLAKLPARAPVKPSIGGLVYPGRRHAFSGPPESLKTWAAYCIAIEHIRAGGVVLHVDFEMFEYETRDRLRAMGITDAELAQFLHVEPDTPANDDVIKDVVKHHKPTLAIIDAAAGAYDLQGLDDNSRKDAEKFAGWMIEPFRARDIATIVLDHVTKNSKTRDGFSIGSERKIGGVDVHLGFQTLVPFGHGRTGLAGIATHKDRFGYLPRPRAAELELRSNPETGDVSWNFREAEQTAAGDPFRPTVLMERVSNHLQQQAEPVSRNRIETDVEGNATYLRRAMDALVTEQFAVEINGPNRARLLLHRKPFRSSSSSSAFVPGSSETNAPAGFVRSSPPLQRDEPDEDEPTQALNLVELAFASRKRPPT